MDLRAEVAEAQKARSDLLKWKLVVVAALAATGLGLVDRQRNGQQYADIVLCAIPPLCAYIDLLCHHLTLRQIVIGTYQRGEPPSEGHARYEAFAERARRRGAYSLEDAAIALSSAVFSIALIAGALLLEPPFPHRTAIAVSGAAAGSGEAGASG